LQDEGNYAERIGTINKLTKKWNKHMNEESTDILARKQNIFVFFSKLKR